MKKNECTWSSQNPRQGTIRPKNQIFACYTMK